MSEARADAGARIEEVVRTTEREVLAAGASVNQVVDLASTQVDRLARIVTTGDGPVRAVVEQQQGRTQRFLDVLDQSLVAQAGNAEKTGDLAQGIARAASAVGRLAKQSQLLAINARIEAGRFGAAGSAFGVLADELKRLANETALASQTIATLATSVSELAPQVTDTVASLREATATFSADAQGSLVQVEALHRDQSEQAERDLLQNDIAAREILQAAMAVLSHLQFEDIVSQGLRRLDERLRRAEIEVREALSLDVAEVPPAMHVEIGGEKAVDAAQAGVVQLF